MRSGDKCLGIDKPMKGPRWPSTFPEASMFISGSAVITSGSSAQSFDVSPIGGDVSSEWGYGKSTNGNCCARLAAP
jgi:hypothetical protein